MGSRILICVIAIFALAYARANVFAQIIELGDTFIQNYNTDEITQRLLDEQIDSVLKSSHHSRDSIYVAIDTLKEDSDCSSKYHPRTVNVRNKAYVHAIGFNYVGKLIVRHLETSRITTSFLQGDEEGFVSVSGSGILCFEPIMASTQSFSFTKSIKFHTKYEDNSSGKDRSGSFWDSTAKPILVTIGAAAVIALFFLIRG